MKKRKKKLFNNKVKKRKKNKPVYLKKIKKIKKVNKKIDEDLISKVVKFQLSLKPKFNFKLSFNLEKYIQSFFDKISEIIEKYKTLKEEEEKLKIKIKEQAIKDEIKLEKQRNKDIKLFLRKEQALIRIEQAEKQKQFLQQLKLEKQIEKFRIREVKELERLERISLKEKREDYAGLQQRIEKLKEKYRIIRDQKIRERVEALGVKIQGDEDRETLLQKEKEYTIARQKIEFALESFDRRFETGEIFVKWDEAVDEEWLLLIYIKNNSPDEGIVIEDKTDPEKNISHEFKTNEIFKASDTMVDALTQLIAKKREKNTN